MEELSNQFLMVFHVDSLTVDSFKKFQHEILEFMLQFKGEAQEKAKEKVLVKSLGEFLVVYSLRNL